jgi:hypothetical protein
MEDGTCHLGPWGIKRWPAHEFIDAAVKLAIIRNVVILPCIPGQFDLLATELDETFSASYCFRLSRGRGEDPDDIILLSLENTTDHRLITNVV